MKPSLSADSPAVDTYSTPSDDQHYFCILHELIPDIVIDLKYASTDNFTGRPVPGYENARAVLTREAATALKSVQDQLRPLGLGLKIFDAYRPQRSVDYFMGWAADKDDNQGKAIFYPSLDKEEIIPRGYLASPSGHSRGSTVDLTLIRRSDDSELDMGTCFDFFGPASRTDYSLISETQRSNRMFLQKIMNGWNFSGIAEEWWHFTLKNEPFPTHCFNFLSGEMVKPLTGQEREP